MYFFDAYVDADVPILLPVVYVRISKTAHTGVRPSCALPPKAGRRLDVLYCRVVGGRRQSGSVYDNSGVSGTVHRGQLSYMDILHALMLVLCARIS